jgi:hypothetical protein
LFVALCFIIMLCFRNLQIKSRIVMHSSVYNAATEHG